MWLAWNDNTDDHQGDPAGSWSGKAMARNPRDIGISWRARPCATARRAIGASRLACALAGVISAAALGDGM